jgi:hypothetical protein
MDGLDIHGGRGSLDAFGAPGDGSAAAECAVTLLPMLACWGTIFGLPHLSIADARRLTPVKRPSFQLCGVRSKIAWKMALIVSSGFHSRSSYQLSA